MANIISITVFWPVARCVNLFVADFVWVLIIVIAKSGLFYLKPRQGPLGILWTIEVAMILKPIFVHVFERSF